MSVKNFPNTESLALSVAGLPDCHSRRDYDRAAEVFFCAHPNVHSVGNLVTPDVCRSCTRWQDPPPPRFREYPPEGLVIRHGPCLYLGQQIGLRDCPSCRGHVKVKVFTCSHPAHESTTLADCLRCGDYRHQFPEDTTP